MASVIMCLPIELVDQDKLRRFLTTHEDFKDWHEILDVNERDIIILVYREMSPGEITGILQDDIDPEQRLRRMSRSSSLDAIMDQQQAQV